MMRDWLKMGQRFDYENNSAANLVLAERAVVWDVACVGSGGESGAAHSEG